MYEGEVDNASHVKKLGHIVVITIVVITLDFCTIFGTIKYEVLMDIKAKKLGAVFYRTETGVEPVRDWLKELSKTDKKAIGENIKTVQFGWPLGMPLVDNLGHGLWEVRTKLSGGRIARVVFFMDSNTMILVNGFIKKTQRTPKPELDLARKRKKQYALSAEK